MMARRNDRGRSFTACGYRGFAIHACVLLLSLTVPVIAHAACSNPAGTAGQAIYNSDHKYFQYCDGTNWIKMNQKAGSGTGGCSSPTGSDGAMIYNGDSCIYQGCAGSVWRPMGPAGANNPASTNLIGHWKYDETSGTTAADSSGNGFNGTMLNGLSGATNSVAGRIGTALDGDGVDDYTSVAYNAAFDGLLEVTIAMWIKRVAINVYKPLFSKTNSSGDYPITFEICDTATGVCGAGEGNKLSLYSNKTAPNQAVSTGTIADTNWHHVAVTRKNNGADTTVTFYIDGVSSGATTVNTATYGTAAMPLRLGKETSAIAPFDGPMDDIRFYGRALTAAEISQLYLLGAGGRVCNPAGTCSSPAGVSGDMIYNADSNVMQYCNGTAWLTIGK